MRKSIVVICLLIAFFQFESKAQVAVPANANVVNVKFNISQDKVIIKYDIINAKKSDLFNISVKAFDSNGDEIVMSNVKGNLKSVSPGVMKSIVWYAGDDLKTIGDNFNIMVFAELINSKIINPITKREAYIYSTLYPGLGTYKLSGKKIHLAKGLISYSLVSVSVINGIKSRSYYDDYTSSMDINDRNEFYQKSVDKGKVGNILAISAATVWLLEYVNIYLAKNKFIKNDVELGMQIDQFSNLPMVSINLKF